MFLAFALSTSCSDSGSSSGDQPVGGGAAGGSAGVVGGSATSGAAAGGTTSGGAAAGQGPRGGAGSSAGGAELGGSAAGGGDAGGEGGEPREPPVECGPLVAAPAKFETFAGFTSSEDFVFDEQGNYVGVDGDSNLVRITKAGKKTLWAPGMGQTAGMAMLPDGSLVIADVGNGAVKRVYANGASEVVLGGLLYPNGLDIGPDGFIYVAENNAGRVRRIDPDTRAYTIVAMGLYGPNGVAFPSDAKTMYVGSFEGSGVYQVDIPQPGAVGTSKILAKTPGSKLPEPTLACPDSMVGKACVMFNSAPGKCQKLSNVVDCVPDEGSPATCEGKPNGTACQDEWGASGTCTDGFCIGEDPCSEGSPTCTTEGGVDGLGVDACGYVYATEFQRGVVWRIAPSGAIEKLVELPSAWIPNIKWGRGLGGFERDVMYVADRDEGRLFGIAVERPGASEYYDLGKP